VELDAALLGDDSALDQRLSPDLLVRRDDELDVREAVVQ